MLINNNVLTLVHKCDKRPIQCKRITIGKARVEYTGTLCTVSAIIL